MRTPHPLLPHGIALSQALQKSHMIMVKKDLAVNSCSGSVAVSLKTRF